MNLRIIGIASAMIGFALGIPSIVVHDIATALSGAGACVMAVVLYQQQDFKERLIRIENHIISNALDTPKKKGHSA